MASQHNFFLIIFRLRVYRRNLIFVWESSPTIFVGRSDANLNLLSLFKTHLLLELSRFYKAREVLCISRFMRQIDSLARHLAGLTFNPVPSLCFDVNLISLYFVAKSFRLGPNQFHHSFLVYRRNLKTLVGSPNHAGLLFWFGDDGFVVFHILVCLLALLGLLSLLLGLLIEDFFPSQNWLLELSRHFLLDEFL